MSAKLIPSHLCKSEGNKILCVQSSKYSRCPNILYIYKVVQIWPGLIVCKQVTIYPGHIWTTLYISLHKFEICDLCVADLGISLMKQVVMWIMKDELLHTESCSSKILLKEVQLAQFLPSLLVTHEPATVWHVRTVSAVAIISSSAGERKFQCTGKM